jgi:hypothetical protein
MFRVGRGGAVDQPAFRILVALQCVLVRRDESERRSQAVTGVSRAMLQLSIIKHLVAKRASVCTFLIVMRLGNHQS